jgi:PncC family amidohydrolase
MFDETVLHHIREQLIRKNQTIAVAESVTAGLLQLAFASAEEAIRFFQGGLTAYNLGQKYRHLGVEPIHAEQCNCVDRRVAMEMARGVTGLFRSDWGIAVTGYATPVPESDQQLFAYYAIAFKKEVLLEGRLEAAAAPPLSVQKYYADYLLTAFRNILQHSLSDEG